MNPSNRLAAGRLSVNLNNNLPNFGSVAMGKNAKYPDS
jgi:hypothetical protein